MPWYFLLAYPVIFVFDRKLDQRYGKLVMSEAARAWLINKSAPAAGAPPNKQ